MCPLAPQSIPTRPTGNPTHISYGKPYPKPFDSSLHLASMQICSNRMQTIALLVITIDWRRRLMNLLVCFDCSAWIIAQHFFWVSNELRNPSKRAILNLASQSLENCWKILRPQSVWSQVRGFVCVCAYDMILMISIESKYGLDSIPTNQWIIKPAEG